MKDEFSDEPGHVVIEVSGPFYNDPAPPDGKPGEPYYELWNYEVAEMFFLNNETKQYLELEFSPHGEHLVLLLDGVRNAFKHSIPLDYKAEIKGARWSGVARVPVHYFPKGVNRFNAYSISGEKDEDKIYKALFAVPGEQPDFHRIEYFQPFDTTGLPSLTDPTEAEKKAREVLWTHE